MTSTHRPPVSRRTRTLLESHEAVLVLVAIALVVTFELTSGNFISVGSVRSILTVSSIEIIIAAALAVAMIARQIDLSVGVNLGVTAYLTASTLSIGLPPLLACLLAVTAGTLMGYFNGVIITRLRVPSIIATLGTASVYKGLLILAAPHLSGLIISASQIPAEVRALGSWDFYGIGFGSIVAVVVAIVLIWVVANTRWGSDAYAIGSNPDGARTAGIDVDRQIRKTMAVVGAAAGLGGFLYVVRYANADLSTGLGLEFTVIAQVVVGGVALTGGTGRVVGAVLGVLVIEMISRGLVLSDLGEFWKPVVLGAAIVLTAGLNEALKRARRNGGVKSSINKPMRIEKEVVR